MAWRRRHQRSQHQHESRDQNLRPSGKHDMTPGRLDNQIIVDTSRAHEDKQPLPKQNVDPFIGHEDESRLGLHTIPREQLTDIHENEHVLPQENNYQSHWAQESSKSSRRMFTCYKHNMLEKAVQHFQILRYFSKITI